MYFHFDFYLFIDFFYLVRGWLDDYNTNFRNYTPPELQEDELENFNKTYEEVKKETAEDWVKEFTEQEMNEREDEERWYSQFLQDDGNAWAKEFTSSTNEKHSASHLTSLVSQIPDQKLQNSKFMEFIKQIDSGEIVLDDLKKNKPNID